MASERCSPYLPFTFPRSAWGLKNWLRTSLGSSKSQEKLWKPPGALPEPFKRPSAGIMRLWCNLGTISHQFSPPQKVLGASKSSGPQKSSKSVVLSVSSRFRHFHLEPPLELDVGPPWAASGGPRSLKPVLNLILDRPRALQECFWRAPESSKSGPSGLQEPSRPPRCPSGSPRKSQRPNKRPRGCSKRPPGRNFQPRGLLKKSAKKIKNTLDPSEQH